MALSSEKMLMMYGRAQRAWPIFIPDSGSVTRPTTATDDNATPVHQDDLDDWEPSDSFVSYSFPFKLTKIKGNPKQKRIRIQTSVCQVCPCWWHCPIPQELRSGQLLAQADKESSHFSCLEEKQRRLSALQALPLLCGNNRSVLLIPMTHRLSG